MAGNTTIGELNPIRYRGYYYDTETELYYLNSRYYDPEVCRFINADDVAILFLQSKIEKNLFVYCENMPVAKFDSTGYLAYNAYAKQSWIFKLVRKFKNVIRLDKDYTIIDTDKLGLNYIGFQLKVSVGYNKGKKALNVNKLDKNKFKASFKLANLSLGWGGKLQYGFNLTMGQYQLNYMRGVDWTKSYFAVTISYTTKDEEYTGNFKIYVSVHHLLKLAIAVLITAACIYVPVLAPAFSKVMATLSASASKIISIIASALALLQCIAV